MNEKHEPQDEQSTEGQVQTPAQDATLSSEEIAVLQAKASERDDLQQRLLRLQADFDNFRRRTQREKEDLAEYASQKLISSLLPIIDNFERALNITSSNDECKGILQGVQMINRQLVDQLQKEGLTAMDAQGQPFDPNVHEAVMQVAADGVEDNTVVEVLQKGYRLKDRVIRPAMVKVARK
ncbi:MAG: nucleotide exchange factor GrpE [Bacillota bacterium]